MATIERLKRILRDVLNLGERAGGLTADSLLLGSLPEFDSIAVISVITTIEDEFGITVEDDEVTADVFESLGTLTAFVDSKAVPA